MSIFRTKRFYFVGAILFMLLFFAGCAVDNSIVQVWRSQVQPEAFGIVVGDGSQVLTVIDYEEYNAGDVKVAIPGLGYYNASFQATDSRTGATLFKLEGIKRTPVITGDASTLTDGQKLLIKGWTGNSETIFKTTPVLVSEGPPDLSPLAFNVQLPQGSQGSESVVNYQGAVVTDEEGKVLGLESIYTHRLVMRLGYPGYIPPIISISSALELLSLESAQQQWANGPLLFSVTGKNGLSGNYDGFVKNYAGVANAIQTLITQLENPVSIDDIPQNYLSYFYPNGPQDGTLLTTLFPLPVALRNEEGATLARAKWIGIQWGRDNGNPNRIIYGTSAYNVSGAFELKGDITNLENIVKTQVDHPYGP
jgi:hypothetical protein